MNMNRLIGTALAVAHLARALLRVAALLPDVAATFATWNATPAVGSHRGGWDTPTPGGSTGDAFPEGAVGHLGYTGTSVWLAPRERVVVVLLTNRVHPVDAKEAIRAARPRIHDAVARELHWRGPLA